MVRLCRLGMCLIGFAAISAWNSYQEAMWTIPAAQGSWGRSRRSSWTALTGARCRNHWSQRCVRCGRRAEDLSIVWKSVGDDYEKRCTKYLSNLLGAGGSCTFRTGDLYSKFKGWKTDMQIDYLSGAPVRATKLLGLLREVPRHYFVSGSEEQIAEQEEMFVVAEIALSAKEVEGKLQQLANIADRLAPEMQGTAAVFLVLVDEDAQSFENAVAQYEGRSTLGVPEGIATLVVWPGLPTAKQLWLESKRAEKVALEELERERAARLAEKAQELKLKDQEIKQKNQEILKLLAELSMLKAQMALQSGAAPDQPDAMNATG